MGVARRLTPPLSSAIANELQATQYGDFDRYVLALSWQTGFCQSQHERDRREPDECRLQKEVTDNVDFLTVHGLWPGLPKSIASRGVDERRWMRFGCATRPILIYRRLEPVVNVPRQKQGFRWKPPPNSVT